MATTNNLTNANVPRAAISLEDFLEVATRTAIKVAQSSGGGAGSTPNPEGPDKVGGSISSLGHIHPPIWVGIRIGDYDIRQFQQQLGNIPK